ncbi:MAG: hypothetical protein RL516_1653 [Bacteroidota bacterium]|jgi:hypothetical protein
MKNYSLIILTSVLVTFTACKKETPKPVGDNDTSTAVENAMADAAFNDVANIADEAYTGTVSSYKGSIPPLFLSNCASVSFDTAVSPKKFTIDFGTTNCLCNDVNYRRGKIIVAYQGFYRDSGSTHTITFDNYYVNDNRIDGSKTVTNKGRNNNGHLSYDIAVNGTITWDTAYFGSASTSSYTANRTREWSEGESTLAWTDDVYLISGTQSGVTRTGASYTASTVYPLKKEIGYRHITDGTLAFTPQGKFTRYINYGYPNGDWDNLAQVTINGYTYIIQLR